MNGVNIELFSNKIQTASKITGIKWRAVSHCEVRPDCFW